MFMFLGLCQVPFLLNNKYVDPLIMVRVGRVYSPAA
jgi:hypothetical protein